MLIITNTNYNFNKFNFNFLYSPMISSLAFKSSFKSLYFAIRGMKKITSKITSTNQEKFALHIQEFITSNFQQITKSKDELLNNNINFITQKGLNENILNQSITKSAYPRSSFTYSQVKHNMHLSNKIIIAAPNNKSDFRLICELKTASNFAESSSQIQQIIINSENPKNSKIDVISSSGNKHKDITLELKTNCAVLSRHDMDIKSGNNANNPFSGILAEIPHLNSSIPYCIINEPLSLDNIQKERVNYLSSLQQNPKIREISIFIKHLNTLPLNNIQKNVLIQEKMFNLMSENLLSQRPSFYYAYFMDKQNTVNKLFLEKLTFHIKPDIFDNTKNAQKFMAQAIKIYNETINDVTPNIMKSKNIWMGTGFEHIADDLFK